MLRQAEGVASQMSEMTGARDAFANPVDHDLCLYKDENSLTDELGGRSPVLESKMIYVLRFFIDLVIFKTRS